MNRLQRGASRASTVRLSVDVSQELFERIATARAKTHRTTSQLMTEWAERGLAELEATYSELEQERRAS